MTDSPAWMFTKALSHRQKVCRLYKRALKEVDNWYGGDNLEVRYQKVIMRARFDANKDENDSHALDPGGSSYDRERESPDVVSTKLNNLLLSFVSSYIPKIRNFVY
uniref:NADH dehydrogenase [ubiquinone] 1 beta subcomplex subunit 9 n=1 Tax=Heterorhabditis bacteriophora TaxID=37862 RepID=A0A1I7WPQ0_HETBA